MTRAEIIQKLEKLAEEGGTIAELNACKALLALPEFQAEESGGDPFKELDGDELAPRRNKRVA